MPTISSATPTNTTHSVCVSGASAITGRPSAATRGHHDPPGTWMGPGGTAGRLIIHPPTALSIFGCLSMVQLMAGYIYMRGTLCGHFLQVALTPILVGGYATPGS